MATGEIEPVGPTKELTVECSGHKKGRSVVFKVPAYLELIKKVGSGAYGVVCSFTDTRTGSKVAVKKITDAFDDLVDGKRILREVRILSQLSSVKHDNITQILDMFAPDGPDFDDIYIVMDLMETDLHRVIYSKQVLTEEHHSYFSYQILRGLLYLHSADVLHRDLKPQNILANKNCDLKICDFGLARGLSDAEDDPSLTDYVVTRWYRAPEVVLLASEYTKAVDVWSVGCILFEMIVRKPLFCGKDHLDQIKKILAVLGTPSERDLAWLPESGQARSFLRKIPTYPRQPWETVFAGAKCGASAAAIEAVDKMLLLSPTERLTVPQCMLLKYFEELHVPDDEPVAESPVDWAFDRFVPAKRLLQNYIYAECQRFHPEIATRDAALLESRGIPPLLA